MNTTNKTNNLNITDFIEDNYTLADKVKILLFLCSLIFTLVVKNVLISSCLLLLIIIFDRRFLFSVILITPLIETVLIVTQGLTITKILVFFLLLLFSIEILISNNKLQFDKRIFIFSIYLFIIILSILNTVIYDQFLVLANWDISFVTNVFFKTTLPKILFIIIFYMYLKIKGINFIKHNLKITLYSISLSLIFVSFYFARYAHTSIDWWNVATRLEFKGADPNEFSAIFVSLGVFPLSLSLLSPRKIDILLGLTGFCSAIYAALLTLSRGGILTILFLLFVLTITIGRLYKKKLLILFCLILGILTTAILCNFITLEPLYARFFGEHVQDISSLTAGRSDWLKNGLRLFLQRPLLGFGGSTYVPRWLNYQRYGSAAVMHNLYMGILIQYGSLGLFAFLTIIALSIKGISKIGNNRKYNNTLVVPYLSMFSLLFAGLALSWQWREILWYLITINTSISYFLCSKLIYHPKDGPDEVRKTC